MTMKRLSLGLVMVMAATAGMITVTSLAATTRATASADPPAPTGSVTLITGDRVDVRGDGVPVIAPGPGRSSMPFRVARAAGRLTVVPGDAAALVAAGRLDGRLFDVTTLLNDGYADGQRNDLPLIVQYNAAAPRPAVATGAVVRQLSSVNGAAIVVPKKDARSWWDATTSVDHGVRTLRSEYTKIWLNGRRRVTLDHSAAQIGAPAAWQAGLTGSRVRVAVLDSGIGAGHPDLAGKVDASANFTAEPAGDHHGHGTHVASIVAGSGAASGGRYRGVAPDVRLLDAKVCDREGSCPEDAIIAGMEWAAATQHAAVANVSLGGLDTPGVDPLEQAVNTLSAQHGTLFVIAAGNSGSANSTIESPGSADAALTVGAVDRQDAMAGFSSRGPRVGDGALKPDVTAPGLDIVAARAPGTERGEVVDEQYVRLSGTSMATPHVAGAAAIMFQQHPGWTGEQVKAALMASAKVVNGVGVLDQGAGRVDVAKAITQVVDAAPASLSFGIARWPHDDDPVLSKTVTYRNTGPADVTLDLTLEASGSPFAVHPSQVVVPAGGTGQVTVTADTRPAKVPLGRHTGRLLSTAHGTVVTATPLGVEKEGEYYDVTLTHIGRDGGTPGSYVTFLDRIGDCGTDIGCGGAVFGSDRQTTLRLPAGRYTLAEFSTTAGRTDMSVLMQSVLDVSRDVSITVDARRAKPVQMIAPRGSARVMQWDLNVTRDVKRPGTVLNYFVSGDHSVPLHTVDLGGQPAGKDDLVSFIESRLAEPGSGGDYVNSPYEYQMAKATFGTLFTGLRLAPRQQDFATVVARYAAVSGVPRDVKTSHSAQPTTGRPEMLQFSSAFAATRLLAKAPFQRTEYFLADGLRWRSGMEQGDLVTRVTDYVVFDRDWRVYRPGVIYRPARWGQAVFGPNLDPLFEDGHVIGGVGRLGDNLSAQFDMFIDADPGHTGIYKFLPGTRRLLRDGEPVDDWAHLPAGTATYRLEASLSQRFALVSTTVTCAWTFRSGHVAGNRAAVLPLLEVGYRPELDEYNHARAGGGYRIPVEVTRQSGAGHATVTGVTVEVSYDDGKTWQTAPVTRDGARWSATVDNPASGAVSLRTRAADTDGNSVEQTTIRAYLVND
jgi:subtilisin family serine protease